MSMGPGGGKIYWKIKKLVSMTEEKVGRNQGKNSSSSQTAGEARSGITKIGSGSGGRMGVQGALLPRLAD